MKRRITLRNDIREIPALSAFVDGLAEEASLDPALAASLNLALEEAVTNVIMYAYPEGEAGQIEVQAERFDDRFEFTVIDSGRPFDPTSVPDADITLGVAERPVGGLGIFLVRRIMDSVSYVREQGRNVLRMLKKTSQAV